MSGFSIDDNHSRTVIHIDLDCFYAQVEMLKNPALTDVPLGVQQKNIVVTSNYPAREYGIKKCMLLSEARALCPELVLVRGEDLHDYRQMSYKVTTHLQKYSPLVERLGLDENYVDVTGLVADRLRLRPEAKPVGHVYGVAGDVCRCGCYERLSVGSAIAQEMRESLERELKLTSCAGIGHNKLLAKLAGATHKPNQQTVVFPNSALELMFSLKTICDIPGIGKSTMESLQKLGVTTIQDLQNCDCEKLKTNFPVDKAKSIYNLAYGQDPSPVKATGKPQSIGLEDSCKSITIETEVMEMIGQLLKRLMVLVNEDGRVPRTIKLVVRKFDSVNKVSHRETKQCNINSTLFAVGPGIRLTDASERKLSAIVMNLFAKVVDMKRPYHITLLGVSFTKFQERAVGRNSITSFLKKNVEVQAVTSIENKRDLTNSLMDYTNNANSDVNTDGSESEIEPSPKKKKFTTLIARRRCFNKDYPSPSKLNVAELHIKESPEDGTLSSDSNQNIHCPPNADREVFGQLPKEMQEELWKDYKRERDRDARLRSIKKPKLNTIMNYFLHN